MGRPKTYDREEILDRAMHLFWRRGYEGTSTADLEAGMGVNRSSLYAEFESKQRLYEDALDRYLEHEVPGFLTELFAPEAGLDAIRAVLGRFAAAAGQPGTERGCLICNAATERSCDDLATRARVDRYVTTLRGGFERALRRAVEDAEVAADLDVASWSARLTTTLLGVFVLIRAQLDGGVARATVSATLAELSASAPSAS